MPWYSDFELICRFDVPLAQLTSFRLGGPARFVLTPRSHAELASVLRRCRENMLETRLLGRGANILPDDSGFDGAIIRLSDPTFTGITISRRSDSNILLAGGGADLGATVRAAVRGGLDGLDGLAGIPATIGGALRMNAGGKFGQIGTCVSRVLVMHPDGRLQWIDKVRAGFAYRTSNLGDYIILAAEFAMPDEDPKTLLDRYRQVWIYKRQHQPLAQRSAGCVFRNPEGRSAGQLVDQAGCKGLVCGGATISTLHANFIVAEADCTSADVRTLIQMVRDRVFDRFGLWLQTEIEIWPQGASSVMQHKRSCA
jgi:UDP-N-acetylmuramate dehydrogenase